MLFVPVLLAIGVGGIVLGGCSGPSDRSENDADNLPDRASASSFQKMSPPPLNINSPQSQSVSQVIRPDAVNVGKVPANERNLEAWAAREGVMRVLVRKYQDLYPSSLFPESDPESRKKAIKFMCESIFALYMNAGRQPFTVSYTTEMGTVAIHKVENPVQVFEDLLTNGRKDAGLVKEFDAIRREVGGGKVKDTAPLESGMQKIPKRDSSTKKSKAMTGPDFIF